MAAEDWRPDPELPYAQVPRTVRESAAGQGPEWWARLAWSDAKQLHGQTFIEVPRPVRAVYGDLKVEVIAEVEAAGRAMMAGDTVPRELAWMKLSLMDALVLNSSRSPGESQTVCRPYDPSVQGRAMGVPLAGGHEEGRPHARG